MFVSTRLSSSGPGHHHRDDRYDLGGGKSDPLNYGLYGLYEILKRRARFVGRCVDGLYGLYEFLKRRARLVGRRVDGL